MRQYRYSRVPPEFLLTHPLSESRVADTRNRAEQFAGSGSQDSLRYQLMRARVQLTYESSPGLAAKRFRALLDENPELDAARYGLALAQIKSGQLKEAGSNLQPLLAKAPNDIVYNLAQVELDIAGNRLDVASQRLQRLLDLYPANYPARQSLSELLLKQNRPAEAEQQLDRLLKERPSDAELWFQQAETRGLSGNIIGLHQARAEYFALVGDYDQALEQLDFARRRANGNFQLAARIDARHSELADEKRMIDKLLR